MSPVALRVQTPTIDVTLPGDREAVVGRASGTDIVISHPRVSRRHVALTPTPDGWVARDLSTNGIWHNGARVKTVLVGAGATVLRLGVADGPELTLTALVPADQPGPAGGAEPAEAEAETVLAHGSAPRPIRPAAPNPATPNPAAPNPATPNPAAAPPGASTPAPPVGPAPATQPAPPATPAQPRRRPPRWLSTVPTLVWLFAAAFAIGALVALS